MYVYKKRYFLSLTATCSQSKQQIVQVFECKKKKGDQHVYWFDYAA